MCWLFLFAKKIFGHLKYFLKNFKYIFIAFWRWVCKNQTMIYGKEIFEDVRSITPNKGL